MTKVTNAPGLFGHVTMERHFRHAQPSIVVASLYHPSGKIILALFTTLTFTVVAVNMVVVVVVVFVVVVDDEDDDNDYALYVDVFY